MIFPDLPKHHKFFHQHQVLSAEAPVVSEEVPKNALSAEEWFAKHFPDSVSTVPISITKPGTWYNDTRGIIEFSLLCIGFVIWVAYWYQLK